MQRKLLAILLLTFTCCMNIPTSLAATSQNLEWGIEIGDRFDFLLVLEVSGLSQLEEPFYLNVTDIDILEDPITSFWDIGNVSFGGYWTNDTSMSTIISVFDYAPRVAVPVGNWNLLSQLAENITTILYTPNSVEVNIDDMYQWGFSYTLNMFGFDLEIDVIFSKKDGFLASLNLSAYDTSLESYTGGFSIYRDGVLPVINHPTDITLEEGTNGQSIVWNGSDLNPGAYDIFVTNVTGTYLITQNLWNSSDEQFSLSLDGLRYGVHAFSIVLHEVSGLTSYDTVIVNVTDNAVPQISQPDDIEYIMGETGNNLTWIIEDANPRRYSVYADDTLIGSGNWGATVASIELNLDELPIGVYTYNITVEDLAGNIASDIVIVTVHPDFITAYLPIILSVLGSIGLIGMGFYFYKQRKSKSEN